MVPFQKLFRQCQLQRIVIDQQTKDFAPFDPPVSVSSSSSMAGVACNVCTSDSRKGRTIVKSLPFPGTLFSDKVPPISSISLRVMESPRPKPSSFSVPDRRANSPKIFFLFFFRNPDTGVGDSNCQLRIEN